MNGPLNIAANSGIDGLEITQSGSGEALSITGGNALFGDNDKAIFGIGNDLQIYHDGANSYLQSATGNFNITTANGAEFALTAVNDGAVTLFYDGSAKLATTATGIDITGGFTATAASTITTADNSTQLSLISTDADSAVGPVLDLFRNSATPGNFDLLGKVLFSGEDDGGNKTEYAHLQAYPQTITGGAESGYFEIHTLVGGTDRSRIEANATEVSINPTGIDSNFRVRSGNNTNALFLEGGNSFVGLSTNAPLEKLQIDDGNIVIYNTGVSSSTNATIGHISGRGRVGSTDPLARMSFGTDAIYYHGVIDFQLANDYAVGALETRLKLYVDEAVFNEDSADVDFRVESDNLGAALSVNGANGNVTMQGATTTIGSAAASTNVQLNVSGVASKAQRIQFQESGVNKWLLGQGAASETSAFELYNAGGVIALSVDRTSNIATFQRGAVFNEGSADSDFRVESDSNDHMLFVDASTNRVGVGKTGPNYPLDVANPNAAETTITAAFRAGGDSDNNRSNIFIGQQENSRGLLIRGGRESGDRAIAQFILNGSGGTIGSNIVNFLEAYEVTGSTAFDVTINQDGENIDFKVESQNESQMFVVDASADAVIMGNQRFANTPTSTNNEFIHFSSPQQEVSSNSSTTINLFVRSASGTVVPCCGTVYVSCENSGQNVSWSYIIDFFYSNSTFTTTARATGNSQGTTTCTVQENGAGVSCTVAYTSGLGGNIRFHAGGHASVGNY
jgi:hypothetical protein